MQSKFYAIRILSIFKSLSSRRIGLYNHKDDKHNDPIWGMEARLWWQMSAKLQLMQNKTIKDGGITDFWNIKVHTSNWNSLWIMEYLGIIEFLWIIKVHTFIWNDLWTIRDLGIITKDYISTWKYYWIRYHGKILRSSRERRWLPSIY